MSQTLVKDRKILLVSIVAAATSVIAGILHLMMVPMSISREVDEGILFLVGGILQIFWAVPVIKRWGRIWQIIGIVGTVVFTALWFATHTHSLFGSIPTAHVPENITPGNISHFPRGPPPRGIASIPQIEYFQIAFIGLYATLSLMISRKQKVADKK